MKLKFAKGPIPNPFPITEITMNAPILKMASVWTLQFPPFSYQSRNSKHPAASPTLTKLKRKLNWNRAVTVPKFRLGATNGSANSVDDQSVHDTHSVDSINPVSKLQGMLSTLPPVVFVVKGRGGVSLFMIWLCVATAFLVVALRVYVVRKSRYSRPGSVADLVRRGQLRSHSRGISRPLKYDDPFNNPFVKVGKSNSTIEMCGKVYRLAPVTLTEEQQAIHQKRRSRAYQWKRPTVFLKEGDSIPPDVDPETVRWIPANHPFATTTSDIDEELAQTNVHQKHGVPFRIQAEHEALQRKLEALQNEQKLNKLFIDGDHAKDFERPLKLNPKSNKQVEQMPLNNQAGNSKPSRSDSATNSLNGSSSSEEMQKP